MRGGREMFMCTPAYLSGLHQSKEVHYRMSQLGSHGCILSILSVSYDYSVLTK